MQNHFVLLREPSSPPLPPLVVVPGHEWARVAARRAPPILFPFYFSISPKQLSSGSHACLGQGSGDPVAPMGGSEPTGWGTPMNAGAYQEPHFGCVAVGWVPNRARIFFFPLFFCVSIQILSSPQLAPRGQGALSRPSVRPLGGWRHRGGIKKKNRRRRASGRDPPCTHLPRNTHTQTEDQDVERVLTCIPTVGKHAAL